MKKSSFCNALDNYVINDQMQSAIKLVEKATQLEVSTVLNIFSMIDTSPYVAKTAKHSKPSMGHLIYTELMNYQNRYSFTGSAMIHRITKFNFKRHFEHI